MDSPFYFCCVRKEPVQCEGFSGPCSSTEASKVRLNTQYSDDASNWAVLCPVCEAEAREYWNEMWSDYYSDKL